VHSANYAALQVFSEVKFPWSLFFEARSSSSSLYFFESFGGVELLLSVAFSELLLGGGLLVPPEGVPSCLLGALAPPGDGSCLECGVCSPEPGFTAGSSPVITGLF
jgi:hypothetical protein